MSIPHTLEEVPMRRKPARPVTITPPPQLPSGAQLTLTERRARAMARVWPLLSTSIPTSEIVTSYLDEVLA